MDNTAATTGAASSREVKTLPSDVANKIAAGEVVERPVSVVKELVENAIDAGATRVTIEVEGGGRRLLRVSDDGCGMNRTDAELAVQRHATSKIRTVDDIDAIGTLGFRGEALPSIASVAHFELLTSTLDARAGTRITIDGGHNITITDAARAPGTTVSVRNLFYCVPARAKFLKTTATEVSHIGRVLHAIMLAYPHVGFKYLLENALQYDVPPQPTATPFADALRTRLTHVRGRELAGDLLPLESVDGTCAVRGFISTWSRCVLSRQEMYCFVNQRPVRCGWLPALIKRAFGTLLPNDAYPYAFIFVEIPPGGVDVNIHPSKLEVRFGNEYAVQSAISAAIGTALQTHAAMPQVTLKTRGPAATASATVPAATRMAKPAQPTAPWSRRLSVEEWKRLYGRSAAPEQAASATPTTPTPMTCGDAAPERSADSPPSVPSADVIRTVGQAANKYILATMSGARNGLVVIDQHAAHERVKYDAAVAALEQQTVAQQRLLLPATVQLTPAQAAIIKERIDDLRTMGFAIEEFGVATFKIDAVPDFIVVSDIATLLSDVADELLELGRSIRVEELRRRMLLTLICKGSVTFNQALTAPEMQALVDNLCTTATPWTCPHGRPTMIVIPFDELEKRFGRKG